MIGDRPRNTQDRPVRAEKCAAPARQHGFRAGRAGSGSRRAPRPEPRRWRPGSTPSSSRGLRPFARDGARVTGRRRRARGGRSAGNRARCARSARSLLRRGRRCRGLPQPRSRGSGARSKGGPARSRRGPGLLAPSAERRRGSSRCSRPRRVRPSSARSGSPSTTGRAVARPLAVELAPSRASAVAPGIVDAPISGARPNEERERFGAHAGGSASEGRAGPRRWSG